MSSATPESANQTLDAIIVGTGMAGMYMIHRLREQGLKVQAIEAGSGVGGAWYWNRYPGCRCDVPSIEYSYSFSDELQQEWDWTEAMASQPELERYLNHVADRFELRRDIKFDTRVTSAIYDAGRNRWTVGTDQGDTFNATYCIMATGCLTVPNFPDFKGADTFKGEVYHTALWPNREVDFRGKRVAVIGSGSSGVQTIPAIAATAKQVIAFQRSPVYTFPAQNRPMKPEFLAQAKADYPYIRERQRNSELGLAYYNGPKKAPTEDQPKRPSKNILDLTPQQRRQEIKDFGFNVLSMYADVYTSTEANDIACDLYREVLKELVHDPETAEGLSPRDYPLGCKRPVIDTAYYETFNQDHVTLVDLRQGGIEEITPTGLRTTQADYEFDILVYATGFDAMTGGLKKIDIRGRDGLKLIDKWAHGPRMYLGLQSAGFPNFFTITGPGSPSVLSNVIHSIEQHVEWIGDCIAHLQANRIKTIEPQAAAEDAWVEHVNEVAKGTMLTAPTCNSWYLGTNIPGKTRIFMPYVAGTKTYRQKCEAVVANGYEGFVMTR